MDFSRRSLDTSSPLIASRRPFDQLAFLAPDNLATLCDASQSASRATLQPTVLDLLSLACAVSVLALVGQFAVYPVARRIRRRSYQPIFSSSSEFDRGPSRAGKEAKDLSWAQRSGGSAVVFWSVLKLASLVVLEVLSVISALRPEGEKASSESWAAVTVVGYATLLSFSSLTCRPSVISTRTRTLKAHLALMLLALWTAFFARDIYPLATFTAAPADQLDAITCSQLALLTLAAVVIPLVSPRTYIPKLAAYGAYEPTAEQTASILSFVSYTFLDPLFWTGWKNPSLPMEGLPRLQDSDQAAYIRARLLHQLDPASKDPRAPRDRKRHLGWRLLNAFRKDISLGFALALGYTAAQFLSPFGTNKLLRYLETGGAGAFARPWVWVVALGAGPLIQATMLNTFSYFTSRMFIVIEAGLTLTMLEQTLRIRPTESSSKEDKAQGGGVIGRINNHISSDLAGILAAQSTLMDVVVGPIGVLVSMWALWKLLDYTALVSMALMIAQLPVPAKVAQISLNVQREFSKATDVRVQRISEAVNSLRILKLSGLAAHEKEAIQGTRVAEQKINRRRKLLSLAQSIISQTLPLLTMLATFGTYTLVFKNDLDASTVFSTTAVFEIFSRSLHRLVNLSALIESWVSLQRINTFLHDSEVLDRFHTEPSTTISDDPAYIGFKNATFAWVKDAKPGARGFKLCFDDLRFPPGTLSIVAGPLASGKTSLLHALLGEMHFEPQGAESSYGLPRTGGIAYAAQESWLMNGTIRANITGPAADGSPVDEERYQQTVRQCGLAHDLSLFDAGDQTEVGERGLTLSGGQKARITLARCVYSSAHVLLLDDIFSALDVHTSKFIVDNLLAGPLMKNRTIILVTHHLQLAGPVADFLVTLKDGKVDYQGPVHASLLQALDDVPEEVIAAEIEAVDGPVNQKVAEKLAGKPVGKLVMEEERAVGRVSLRAFRLLLSCLGGLEFWLVVCVGLAIDTTSIMLQTAWLAVWARAYDSNGSVDVVYYLSVYAALLTLAMTAYAIGAARWYTGTVRAAILLHKMLLDAVFSCTLGWLDRTPSGRLLSRFTSFSQIDGAVLGSTYALLEMVFTIAVSSGTLALLEWRFGLAALVLLAVGGLIAQVYINTNLIVKRLSNNAKSPVFSLFGDVLQGLVSVRAYDAADTMRAQIEQRCDVYVRANTCAFATNRWVNVRLDALGSIFSLLVTVYLVYGRGVRDASTVGFTLSIATSMSGMILWTFRTLSQWESSSTAVERVVQYVDCPQEVSPPNLPPAYWPASGSVSVRSLAARYSTDGPLVLQDVNLEIKSGERIGIVGRTGSGKSTFALALLRLIPVEGSVYIDGLDTSTIDLDALRSSVTIIPQDPTLSSGSLRQNIDPYGAHPDSLLLSILHSTGLVQQAPHPADGASGPHELTLDTEIKAGGENLSQGQRQLVALARGLVRRTKVFLLDEATASVDLATDALIQTAIRDQLKGTTLITIAHRLKTIADYDRVLVLDAGRVIEFDTPAALIRAGGRFARMVADSPDGAELRALAGVEA